MVPVKEACEVVSGGTPKTGVTDYWDGDIPWATPKDLSGLAQATIFDTPRKLTAAGLASSSAVLLPAKSVLLSSRAPIGHVAINAVPMATNQGFKNLIPRLGVAHSGYLYHWLRVNRSFLESLGTGATFKEISKRVVEAVEIPLPPIAEQERIAAVLDQVDTLRAKRREAIALLSDLTQSTFSHMFQCEDYPKEPLSEVVRKGTIVTYGIVQAGDEFDGGVPYIRTGDLKDGEIIIDGLRHTDPSIAAKFARSRVEAGDIVMSIRATVGTTALVPTELDGANLTQGTARIAPGNKVTPEYLLAYLRSRRAQSWIQRQVKGATFREITLGKLRELEVPLPPFVRQLEFSQLVQAVEAQLAVHRTHLATLDELFTSLQHRAFSGTLWDHEAPGEAA